jgi:DNA-binding MarR family transcriptional regulator
VKDEGVPRLRTRFDDADRSPGFLLWRVTNRWQVVIRRTLQPYDLTHVQFVLLATLAWLPTSPVTQRTLADYAHTDPMMTSQVIRALEARALVRRELHPDDARARAVSITPKGVRLVNRANTAVEAADEQFFGPLDNPADFATSLVTLDRPES